MVQMCEVSYAGLQWQDSKRWLASNCWRLQEHSGSICCFTHRLHAVPTCTACASASSLQRGWPGCTGRIAEGMQGRWGQGRLRQESAEQADLHRPRIRA